MIKRSNFILFCSAILLSFTLRAQVGIVPIQHYYSNQIENQFSDSLYKPISIRPFINNNPLNYKPIDTLRLSGGKWLQSVQSRGWLNYNHKIFSLHINPLMQLSLGNEFQEKTYYNNIRGIQGYGYIGSTLFFHTAYYESQSIFPDYLQSFVADTGIVPGQGRVKGLVNNKSFDYGWAESVLMYKPNDRIDISFGHNKNHIGFGYRSMLLSDNTVPYLNLRINAHFGRVHYTVIYAALNNFQRGPVLSRGYDKKYFSAHYLNFFPHKNLEIGLFETVIWPGADSTGYRGFDVNYLNPVIFYHATQNYLGSPDNSMIGMNIRYRPLKDLHVYGQFLLDDLDIDRSTRRGFYRNKTAMQAGIKWFNTFGIKQLITRFELNQAQPYTYAHKIPAQNYTAMQQPLAHPLGANFREYHFSAFYEKKRWSADMLLTYAQVGKDIENSHVGNNIFISDFLIPGFPRSYDNVLLQGLKTDIIHAQFALHYLLLPVNRTTVDIIYNYHLANNVLIGEVVSNFISFGIRTNLFNNYQDF